MLRNFKEVMLNVQRMALTLVSNCFVSLNNFTKIDGKDNS